PCGDAGHMASDAASLALAAVAAWVAQRPPSRRHSYGFGRVELFAGLANSLALLALVGWLAVSAIHRLRAPLAVAGEAVSLTAALGLGINLLVAWLLHRGGRNLNIRAALLHVLGDLLGSVAALVAGVVILATGWTPIDPLLSLLIGALLVVSSLRLAREALHALMEGVPLHLSLPDIGQAMAAVEGVLSVHDLHIWSLSGERVALSAHVVLRDLDAWPELLVRLRARLAERFHIEHVTLQPEIAGSPPPPLVSIGRGSRSEGDAD
ncbi:MAG: cation diffusion facilitator family transporter, partial [Thermoanaerobaculia bacterium]|nr:cation diffusion facilitator family transporter [Thermoanaerobaculia bacterium]